MKSLKEIRQRIGWARDQAVNFIETAGGDTLMDPPTDSILHHLRVAIAALSKRIEVESISEGPQPEPTPEPEPEPSPEPTPAPTDGLLFADSFATGLAGAQNGAAWGSDVNASVEDGLLLLTHPPKPRGGGGDSMSVAQIDLELPAGFGELWIEYAIRVPLNYHHRDLSGTPNNNKFFQCFGGARNDIATGTIVELQADGNGGSKMRATPHKNEKPDGGKQAPFWAENRATIIEPDFDAGQWLNMQWHIRSGTPGFEHRDGTLVLKINGVKVMWFDWRGDLVFDDGFPIRPWGGQSRDLTQIRLGGWSNSGYDEETIWAYDDLQVYVEDPGWGI